MAHAGFASASFPAFRSYSATFTRRRPPTPAKFRLRPLTTMTSTATEPALPTTKPPPFSHDDLASSGMPFTPAPALARALLPLKYFLTLRARIRRNSVLIMDLSGSLPDTTPSFSPFSPTPPPTLPLLCKNLRLAAHDRRITSVYLRILASAPLTAVGYAKLAELARHIAYFRASGKKLRVYVEAGGEKDFFLARAASEAYTPPEGVLSLRGFRVAGDFVRGVLDKVGVYPDVQRIGEYKSAGDTLVRTSMSDAQREALGALLDAQVAFYQEKVGTGVAGLFEKPPIRVDDFVRAGWIDDAKYEAEVLDVIKDEQNPGLRQKNPAAFAKARLRAVSATKYYRVRPRTLGLGGARRGARIAVIRATGPIVSGDSSPRSPVSGGSIGSESLLKVLRQAKDDQRVKAVVLRIDSPGGSALASDVLWHAVREVNKVKPVVASMADVAASGGYYIAMAARAIVAERLTITGSIGVVTAKLSLGDLYSKIGFARQYLSRGPLAELEVDTRRMTDAERAYFERGAQAAYRTFWTKACASRNETLKSTYKTAEGDLFTEDAFEELARGRIWTGEAALQRRLVDELGGVWKAVSVAKREVGIDENVRVDVVEMRIPSGGGFLRRMLAMAVGGVGGGGARETAGGWGAPEVLAMCEVEASGGMPPLELYFVEKLGRMLRSMLPAVWRGMGL